MDMESRAHRGALAKICSLSTLQPTHECLTSEISLRYTNLDWCPSMEIHLRKEKAVWSWAQAVLCEPQAWNSPGILLCLWVPCQQHCPLTPTLQKPSPPQHAGTGGQKGPCVPMAAFSASPLLLKGSCKAGQGECVREALGSVLGMLRMENNCSEHRQSHPNRAQVCASEIITQLETASHPRVITKCTEICAGDQRKIVTKRRQGTR